MDEIFARYAPKPLPSTTPASTKPAVGNISKQPKNGQPIPSYDSATFGTQRAPDWLNAGKKRSYHDVNNGQDMQYDNGVVSKAPRSKRPSKDSRPSGRNVSLQQHPSHINGSYPLANAPLTPTPPAGFPAFDPNNMMAAYAFMQTMFPQMAGLPPPSPSGDIGTFRKRPRCQDYDTKGFCVLGSSCPYEHGNDSIVAPGEDEYDPTRANFSMNATNNRTSKAKSRTTRTQRENVSAFHARPSNRAAFSDHRLPSDKKVTSIVVEQIPEEYFEDQTVRTFFSQFGRVVDVTMKPYKRLAIVKYDTHTAAKRAWESPKAIFDNRFVKVYWYRPELENADGGRRSISSSKDGKKAMNEDAEDQESFTQQQEEKQKAHEERLRIKKAMEDAKQDLILRRENMTREHKVLVRRLAIAEGKGAEALNGDSMEDALNGQDGDAPDPKIKALRDQLAKMQAEAKSLGIDPDAPPDDLSWAHSGQRSGFGGPARGGFSGRAAYRGYGSRGGYHWGQGFVRGRDPSVRKLDNRPKNIAVSGVEFDNAKEENLRSYLTLVGPFEGIEVDPQRKDSRIIVFAERWMAEQVMKGKTDIPGVGKVEMSWVATTAKDTAHAANKYEDLPMGGSVNEERSILVEEAQQPGDDNLDVAGGDDDDWGNIT